MTLLAPVMVLDAADGPELPIVVGDGVAQAAVWPGMGARLRSMHVLTLGAGARTVELSHPGDAVYAVLEGDGTVGEPPDGAAAELREGSMFHVDAGTPYVIAAGPDGLRLVGGPAPADPALYEEKG
jgi:quercetin dioxygenase-like cupin family protein